MIGWLHVTSGRGPEECCWVVARAAREIFKEASAKGYDAHTLEAIPGNTAQGLKSAVIAVEGDDGVYSFLSGWTGTLQWIGESPFRPHHKRKNWFVGISAVQPPRHETIREQDLKVERMRASGPGGQHTNTTDSAIRITHIRTGISAVAQEERSQHLNRKLALARLHQKLRQEQEDKQSQLRQERWGRHNSLERGNPVRVYEGEGFRLRR